jgi:hypothetical protein
VDEHTTLDLSHHQIKENQNNFLRREDKESDYENISLHKQHVSHLYNTTT